MQPLLNEMSLTLAACRNDAEVAAVLVADEFAFDDTFPHGMIYKVTPDQATDRGLFPMAFTGISCSDSDAGTVMAVSEGGDVQIFTSDGNIEDGINDITGPLRDISTIAGEVYVCGANHQVYRRAGIEDWVNISPSSELQADFPENHFEKIDGYAQTELYVAGRDGVIWWRDNMTWIPVQAATNFSFTCVTCGIDGNVYLAGQGGVVAVGRRDEFTVYTPEEPLADIWDVEQFDGSVYVATSRALMTWDAGAGLIVVPDAMELGETFYNLVRGPSTLWSLGAKDVLRFDGEVWERFDEVPVN